MNNPLNQVITVLLERQLTISSAESCTAGGFGFHLTSIPGTSSIYRGGMIVYTAEMKTRLLGIDPSIISTYGVYSPECVTAMAHTIRQRTHSDIGIAFSGVAGPGSDQGHPAGEIHIAITSPHSSPDTVLTKHFSGTREEIRTQAITSGIELLLTHLTRDPHST